jgi:alkaline phosphatase
VPKKFIIVQNMKFLVFLTLSILSILSVKGQNPVLIFAHNDYEKADPLATAYELRADFIEADIFLHHNELLVAHTTDQLDPKKSLENVYLKPLRNLVLKNNGSAFPRSEKLLTLMIDLKTEGISTLNALIKKLNDYPELIACKTFCIAISGNVPSSSQWQNFPEYIHFDGRPNISYSEDQLKRIRLISASFKSYSSWDAKGSLSSEDRLKIENVVRETHEKGKPLRFWAAPDFESAWIQLIDLKIDVINTDNPTELSAFLKTKHR